MRPACRPPRLCPCAAAFLAALAGCAAARVPTHELFVSPDGSDAASGTSPADAFATLGRAASAVAALPRPLPPGGVTVVVAPGLYPLNATLELGPQHSGTSAEAPVVFAAAPAAAGGGRPRVIGGVVVPHRPARGPDADSAAAGGDLPPNMPPNARVVDLFAAGVRDFGKLTPRGGCCNAQGARGCPDTGPLTVTVGGVALHRARWPNLLPQADAGNSTRLAWATTATASASDPGLTNTSFTYDPAAPFGQWRDWSDVWAHGLWYFDWNDLLSPVARVDPAARTVHLAPPYPPLHGPGGGITGGARYWLENSADALDAPGEFWLNRSSGMLYFVPPAADPAAEGSPDDVEVVVSTVDTLVSLTGISHLSLVGLSLESCRGTAVVGGSASPAARGERLGGGAPWTGVRVVNCTVTAAGSSGVLLTGGVNTSVSGGEVGQVGCKGVEIAGPDVQGERTAWVDGNSIDNVYVHDWSQTVLTYQPGVTLSGSGSAVRNCDIRTSPHFGISIGGNDQTVEYNLVHHTSEDTFDNGPVYWCPRNWASRGHRIRFNFFFLNSNKVVPCNPRTSCEKPAIYGDDGSSGTLIHGNVIWHPNPGFAPPPPGPWNRGSGVKYWGVFFDGSRDMTVTNNIFVDVNATFNSGEGMTWDMKGQGQNSSTYYEALRAANVTGAAFRSHYPDFAIDDFVNPDCPRNPKCGPALFNQTYARNVAVNTSQLVPFPSTSGLPPGHGVWRATSDAGEPVGPTVPWPPMASWYTVDANLVNKDPRFASPDPRGSLDFQLSNDSPAYALGFQRIPMERIGPWKN